MDFRNGWISQYNEWYGARVESGTQEVWSDFTTLTHFPTEADFWAWVDRTPDFWVNLPPIPGAMGGVLELAKAGHEMHIITHRKEKARFQTDEWFYRHWPLDAERRVRPPEIHFAKDKSSVPCQVYVDDNPRVIRDLAGINRPIIKFAYPYNRDAVGTAGTVKDWKQLVAHIAQLQEALVA